MRISIPFVIAVFAALSMAGCAVVEQEADEISIRHSAGNDLLVLKQANAHCAHTDRRAVLIQRTSPEHGYGVGTVVSTYRCVRAEL